MLSPYEVSADTCEVFTKSSSMSLPLLFAGFAAGVCASGSQVLEVDQRGFNVLETVLPPSESNVTSVGMKSVRLDWARTV